MASLLTEAFLLVASEVTGLGPAVGIASSTVDYFASTAPPPEAPKATLGAGRFVGIWFAGTVAVLAGLTAASILLAAPRAVPSLPPSRRRT